MLCHRASSRGVDINININVMTALAARADSTLPLICQATGTQKGKSLTVKGSTGGVTSLTRPAAVEPMFDLQLQNLKSLYRIAGVVLPSTPLYKLNGKLTCTGWVWSVEQINACRAMLT